MSDRLRLSESIASQHFEDVVLNENVRVAFVNSLIACASGAGLAVVIGLTFAWIVVRTDTPFKRLIAASGMLPLFVPPLGGRCGLGDPGVAQDRAAET